MNLSPDQAQAAIAYYAWKCAQLETMLAHRNEQVDKLGAEITRLTAIDAHAVKTAPCPGPVETVSEGGTPD